MRDRLIIFVSAIVGALLVIFLLGYIFPGFGLWLSMNSSLVAIVAVIAIAILGYFLFVRGRTRVATTTTATGTGPTAGTTTGTPPPPAGATTAPAGGGAPRRPWYYPLSLVGLIAIIAGIALIAFIFLYYDLPAYLLLHVAATILLLWFVVNARGPITGDMIRLLTECGLLIASICLVFTNIGMDPEWLFALLTGGIPLLVLLALNFASAGLSPAAIRYMAAIVDAVICFVLIYVIVALFGGTVDHRLAYAIFLSPLLFIACPLFPLTTPTRAQTIWAVILCGGMAVLYTIVMFGFPAMNIPVPSGLEWKLILMLLTMFGVAYVLSLEQFRNMNWILRTVFGLAVFLILFLIFFPQYKDEILLFFKWALAIATLVGAIAMIVGIQSVDDVSPFWKYVLAILLLAVWVIMWWGSISEFFQSLGINIGPINFSTITIPENFWWWLGMLTVLAILIWLWISTGHALYGLLTAALVLFGVVLLYGLPSFDANRTANNSPSPGSSIRIVTPPNGVPVNNSQPTYIAPVTSDVTTQSIWELHPGYKVDDQKTIHE